MTQGPRTSISPSLSPSLGSSSPSGPTIRISTPCRTRPARIRQSTSSGVPGSTPAGGSASPPTGLISVMPQPWMMRRPYRSWNRSSRIRGAAEPPELPIRSEDRSISWSSP